MTLCRYAFTALALVLAGTAGSFQSDVRKGWPTHGGNSSHTAIGGTKAQTLKRIVWSTPLDLAPQYNGDVLYAHYGSPVITDDNTIILPVKTGANSGFKIEARNGANGTLLWQETTDYITPDHNWFPTLGPTITGNYAAWARKGGLVAFKDVRKGKAALPTTSVCFFGLAKYNANPAAYNAALRISSPLVTDSDGSIFFTYQVNGATPLNLKGGIAMIRKDGTSTYIEGTAASMSHQYSRPKLNAAPAISNGILYAVLKRSDSNDGALVGLTTKTLRPLYEAPLLDPRGGAAFVDDDGTACPTVGPDGDVFFGVLENPFGSHHYRGWLLHFNKTLTLTETPGSFGWDDSASIIPSSLVEGYTGKSSYLVMTKYNNYAGAGDGVNRIAILDPNATQSDFLYDLPVMKEVITVVGPTPDANNVNSFPHAVREWCINTAAVDVKNRSILVNNEDGIVYRWNLKTNTLDQSVRITNGLGQAYTPTLVGPTGLVFAVSNARLFAVGQ